MNLAYSLDDCVWPFQTDAPAISPKADTPVLTALLSYLSWPRQDLVNCPEFPYSQKL